MKKYHWLSGAIAVILCWLGVVNSAQAFLSEEHKQLGNAAIIALMAQYRCGEPDEKNREACSLLASVDTSSDSRKSYGDLLACVDYHLTPEKIIAHFKESKNSLIHTWPDKECEYDPKKIFQASHSNHTHFQKELIVSLATYHQLASTIARDRKNFAGAMVMNAIADHYLHDYFAPGHMTTPRSKLSDLFANAGHDAANEKGAIFHIGKASSLASMKDRSQAVHALVFSGQPGATESAQTRRVALIRTYLLGQSSSESECSQANQMFVNGKLELKGDDFLNRKGGCSQRLLMLVANMLSVEDILLAAQDGQAHDLFASYGAQFEPAKNRKMFDRESHLPDIRAELPFGYYAMGTNAETEGDSDKWLPLDASSVWGLSVGSEQFSTGSGVTRMTGSLETVVKGGVDPIMGVNYGLTLGWYGYGGSGLVSGNGPMARLGFIVPESETTISFGVRRVRHEGDGLSEWGTGWNVRVDQGYSSFLSIYLSAGRDYEAASNSTMSFGTYLSAGAMIGWPGSRFRSCAAALFGNHNRHCM